MNMSTKAITVVAVFEARPGAEGEMKKTLEGLLAPTRREPGCVSYDLHIAHDDPKKFLFYENWRSKELLDQHLKSAHLTAALARAGELSAKAPEVHFWEKLG